MTKQVFHKEVIRIADGIIEKSEKDGNGIFWKTMSYDVKKNIVNLFDHQDIYAGASGIILFLLEVYKVSKDKKYLTCSEKAANWLIDVQNDKPMELDCMHTGNLGVIYTIFKLHAISKKKYLFDEGEKLLAKNISRAHKIQPGFELLNGQAGVLLALLNIICITGFQKEIIPEIEYHLSKIVESTKIYHPGVFWDLYNNNVKPLCGFSHGVSGIAFVLLELFHFTKNPTYVNLAKLAMNYEDSQINKKKNNWPDYRVNIYTEAQFTRAVNEYLEGKFSVLNHREDFVAWCHGATGIGLMRSRASELLQTGNFHKAIRQAVSKTVSSLKTNSQNPNNTICHGDSGAGLFLLYAYKACESKSYYDRAYTIAENLIRFREKHGKYHSGFYTYEEDFSLFSGNAGIGYFFLKTLYGNQIDDLINFALPARFKFKPDLRNHHFLNLKTQQLEKHIFSSNFNLPIQFCNSIGISRLNLKEKSIVAVKKLSVKTTGSEQLNNERLKFQIYIDKLKYKIKNNAAIKVRQQAAEFMSDSESEYSTKIKFKKYDYVGLFQSCFDLLSSEESFAHSDYKKYYYVIYPNENYSFNTFRIEVFEFILLKTLSRSVNLIQLKERLVEFNSQLENIAGIERIIEKHLKNFIKISLVYKIKNAR